LAAEPATEFAESTGKSAKPACKHRRKNLLVKCFSELKGGGFRRYFSTPTLHFDRFQFVFFLVKMFPKIHVSWILEKISTFSTEFSTLPYVENSVEKVENGFT
jgi:hypothetical protein